MTLQPAVFLDRDGTLIEDVGFLWRHDQIRLFPWTIDAIRLLNRAGFAAVVITNQSVVARGMATEDFVRETHAILDERLAAGGARIDRYYFCPHHPHAKVQQYQQACTCRKPAPGMIEAAAADLSLDLARSWMIGAGERDVEAGVAAGTRGILLQPDRRVEAPTRVGADAILNNLMEAVGWILRDSTSR
jgi:D-glycero-D-manno-heptose 1,7-bisphosphate phosphatase